MRAALLVATWAILGVRRIGNVVAVGGLGWKEWPPAEGGDVERGSKLGPPVLRWCVGGDCVWPVWC